MMKDLLRYKCQWNEYNGQCIHCVGVLHQTLKKKTLEISTKRGIYTSWESKLQSTEN